MTTKAKDRRETLQERLRKMTMPVSNQAYPDCIEAADALDAAQAEIAGLKEDCDRTARNRAMWKGQCESQADQLRSLRAPLATTKDIGLE